MATGWLWSWKSLAALWGGAVVLGSTLLFLGVRQSPWKVFWLLPYPNSLRSIGSVYRIALASRPLEASAILIVLPLALALTVVWLGARMWFRFA